MTGSRARHREPGTCRRVCFVSSDYDAEQPAGSGGGIETYVRLMARGLAGAGHDVHVITPATGEPRSFDDHRVHIHAIRVAQNWCDQAPELGEARSTLSFAWHAHRAVRGLIETTGPFDIVEAPEYKGQGYFLADDPSLPVVVKCHAHLLLCLALNRIELSRSTALLADLERETLRKARAIHANSHALARRCADDYGLPLQRFVHVPYGIDTTTFRVTTSRLRERLGLENRRVVLFVGRMEERKGIAALVPAFAQTLRHVPDATLLLVGPDVDGPPGFGSNIAWMSKEWDALGVPPNRFRFLGTVPNADLPDLYSSADVMVAPSPFEAFGFVYLEAMACGCPPVGCTTGGGAEVIVDGETGALVPPHDPSALAHTLTRLLENPDTRTALAASGRALVERQYGIDMMVKRTMQFYEEAVA